MKSNNGKPQAKTTKKKAAATSRKKTAAAAVCPLCKGGMVERDDAYRCAAWRSGCTFRIDKTIAGKKISKTMAKALLTKGETRVLKGFKSKSNQPFDARLKIEGGRVRFEFERGAE